MGRKCYLTTNRKDQIVNLMYNQTSRERLKSVRYLRLKKRKTFFKKKKLVSFEFFLSKNVT